MGSHTDLQAKLIDSKGENKGLVEGFGLSTVGGLGNKETLHLISLNLTQLNATQMPYLNTSGKIRTNLSLSSLSACLEKVSEEAYKQRGMLNGQFPAIIGSPFSGDYWAKHNISTAREI